MVKRGGAAESGKGDSGEEKARFLVIRSQEIIREINSLSGGSRSKARQIADAALRLGLHRIMRSEDVRVALGLSVIAEASPRLDSEEAETGVDVFGLI